MFKKFSKLSFIMVIDKVVMIVIALCYDDRYIYYGSSLSITIIYCIYYYNCNIYYHTR